MSLWGGYAGRPTAADYAGAEASSAQRSAEAAHARNRSLERRVAFLENKVQGLILVLTHVVDPAKLDMFLVDDETGDVYLKDEALGD